jgi:hypothetical protein
MLSGLRSSCSPDEGLSNDVIVSRLDTPRRVVRKWRNRFSLARMTRLEAQPGRGQEIRQHVISQAWSLKSAEPHYGAGSIAMPSAPGNIEARSSRAIPTLRPKPAPSSICITAFRMALRWAIMTSSSRLTKRRAFKPRRRKQPTLSPASHRPTRVEHEYSREGAGLSGCLGCPSRHGLWSAGSQERDCSCGASRHPSDDPRVL